MLDPLRALAGLTGHFSAIHDIRIGDDGGRDGRGRLVRIYSNGTGAPVLAVPDLGSSAAAWLGLTEPLCVAGRQLVAVDLPGSGHCDALTDQRSTAHADHLAAVTEQLAGPVHGPSQTGRADENACDMVGIGFGANIVLTLAAQRPDLVRRAVIIDPTLPPTSRKGPRPRMSLGMVLDGAVTTVRRGRPAANLAGLGRARAALSAVAEPDPAWWSGLTTVTAPVLLVTSGRAHDDGPTSADALADALVTSRRADLPPGSAGPLGDPVRLAELIVPFLER